MKTLFQRPDRIEQPLDVLITVFNSARFRTRWKHYEDFISHGEKCGRAVRLWTAEVAFGNRQFVLTDLSDRRHLQLRTNTELWHKERAQNLLTQHVMSQCPEAEYFAFVDPDISFVRHDWADETLHALQHFDVVQMWREAYDMDPHGHIVQEHESFAACYRDEKPFPATAWDYYSAAAKGGRNYYHPGYAWAWRRRALEAVGGLIDWAVLGSADFHMAYALVGEVERTLTTRRQTREYADSMRRWQERSEREIKRNVGFVRGSILHHWHGPKAARQYKTRWKILGETKFDPRHDLVADVQGLYKFQHHGSARSTTLRDKVRKYFHSRDEDASK